MKFSAEKLRTPQWIFIIYTLVFSSLIMIFRFIFPGAETPLIIYSHDWKIVQGVLEVFNFFPALAFSALIIPFGLASYEENYGSFSEMFFKRIISSVITAIIAAIIYGTIFFLALPMVKNYEEDLRFSGDLYHLAKKNIQTHMEAGEWNEASQFLNICDRIWINSPELADARDRISINLERQYFDTSGERDLARAALTRDWRDDDVIFFTGRETLSANRGEVDATEAIELSIAAFNEKRYFDAHWLANLGVQLAPNGSAQQANATRLASEAWNMITSLAPNSREEMLYELHNIKLSGYTAMSAENWIEAYYIFKRLIELTPDDPDVANFLARSERGAADIAFFIDEMNLSVGEILNGALFSLPCGNGRSVMRFSTLTTSQDVAYGMDFEYMRIDPYNNLQTSMFARNAKLLPITLNDKHQVLVLTHALDRDNEEKGVRGQWLAGQETAGGIILDISYEDFLIVTHVRRGLPNLQIDELFSASEKLSAAGYIPHIFQAEIINRFGTTLFFLPLAIFVIVTAWRYRARTKPRYLFFLMLPVLPVVFHGFVFMYRTVFNTIGIWLVISFGFTAALIIFFITLVLLLFISLLVLSSQHT